MGFNLRNADVLCNTVCESSGVNNAGMEGKSSDEVFPPQFSGSTEIKRRVTHIASWSRMANAERNIDAGSCNEIVSGSSYLQVIRSTRI